MRLLSVLLVFAASLVLTGPAGAGVRPSQVLVLYNADWSGDAPLTDPGPDSREIAELYVARHTDPATGERPYLLGLRCRHRMGHLNGPHLVEESRDNGAGVVLRGEGRAAAPAGEVRDSRLVELVLPKTEAGWRFDTLRVVLWPEKGDPVVVVDRGRSRFPKRVSVQEEGKWNVRLNGRSFLTGPLTAEASIEDTTDKVHTWTARYADILDVSCSRTGADGVPDDRNFEEDVAEPVRRFLEDPANARPDGTLLKDHVLFLVVCYGLPKTAAATYGIARGVTASRGDHGPAVSLEQRLQLLYYDVEGALGFVPRPHRFNGRNPFTAYLFRAPQAWPLYGKRVNPFLHPLAYKKDKGSLDALPDPLRFTPQNRARFPGRHLYFAMRVDGTTPLEARGLIDRAVYAIRYAGPAMGVLSGVTLSKNEERVGSVDRNRAGVLLWARGYRHVYYRYTSSQRLALFTLRPGSGFWNQTDVYLPGGVQGTVISNNGWNRRTAAMVRALARGVTVTVGAARVYNGAPHIHDKSWWDDEILYPLLLRGYTVGEALLANQMHLEWITTFVGDPLYRLPSEPEPDTRPPSIASGGVRTYRYLTEEGKKALWVAVDLDQTRGPEVAQMRLTAGDQTAVCQTFEARPYVSLLRTDAVDRGPWKIELLDPYGNRSETVWTLGRMGP
ncbi:hypothetical protein [Deferrisoma camini]|uniref:hypothetical protein n=1 Tax=Deferrisoma camini TaxID=1035120 RepID=UPI00046D5972|nr:hypothetical protein [Deferrisoma camini]